jgi:predicted Ser/Thr protein kinase
MPTLPPDCPSLLDRLCADQSERWCRGERVRVESYLKEHPGLASDPEALIRLISAEVLLRRENGETPSLEEYLDRFPGHADALRRRWAIQDLIAGNAPADAGTTVSGPVTQPAHPGRGRGSLPAVPGYEVLEELGKGGMGVVFKARQVAFDRLVAVKMVRAHLLAGPDEMSRFRTEARALGQLDDPHVVRVFDFDEEQGCPFFVMQYLSGGSLANLLRDGPLPPRRAAELVRQVARGVQAAHDKGILHRDLKPANVLLDEHGKACVADFGLAKLLDGGSGQTASEAVMGTPAYMAPEQAAGRARDVGWLSDVWALGVILYECLTGRVPFRVANRQETLELIQKANPTAPRQLRAEVPAELEAVCLKCLEKDPRQRYASAAALADDLERWLRGQAPLVRPRAWRARCWRLVWSHRRAALAGLLLVAVAVAVAMALRVRAPEPGPDLPRKEVEATLAAGDPYVFEGGGELPGPFRWVVGEAVPLKSDPVEGCFSWRTLRTALLELVASPGRERYLFSAEVRHDDAAGTSLVGLYFGYREHRTADGRKQSGYFTHLFDERGEVARSPGLRGPDGKPNSFVSLGCGLFEGRKDQDLTPAGMVGRRRLFRPALPVSEPAPWRELAVKVTPEGVEAFWRNEHGQRERIATVPARELEEALEQVKQANPEMKGIPTAFRPASGLGLFIYRGEASFRRISIKPL